MGNYMLAQSTAQVSSSGPIINGPMSWQIRPARRCQLHPEVTSALRKRGRENRVLVCESKAVAALCVYVRVLLLLPNNVTGAPTYHHRRATPQRRPAGPGPGGRLYQRFSTSRTTNVIKTRYFTK